MRYVPTEPPQYEKTLCKHPVARVYDRLRAAVAALH